MKTSRPASAKPAPARKSGGGMLLGLFLGLVVGVLIAFGVVLYLNKTPLPFMNKYEGAPKEPARAATAPAPAGTAAPGQPVPLPGKPGDKVGDKPRFDFYGILEGKQPATPGAAPGNAAGTAAAPAAVPPASTPAPAAPRESFYLQAGAFQKAADADNLKAKLAMLGVEVSVQEAEVADKGKMHRVRVGPLGSAEEMNRVRTQLAQSGVQTTVVKLKAE